MTNLVINTDRRTYLLELRSTEKTYMASVSWQYPAGPAHRAAPAERRRPRPRRRSPPASISPRSTSATRSRATIRPGGRCAPSTTARRSISNSRAASARARCRRSSSSVRPAAPSSSTTASRQNYYIVDRLFAAAELRLGDKDSERASASSAPMEGRGHDGRAGRTNAGADACRAARSAAPGRAAARHAPLAQGADRRSAPCPPSRSRARSATRFRPGTSRRRPGIASTQNRPSAEGLAGLPKDYTGLPRQAPPLGPPLPGDLGKPILNAGAAPNTTVPATTPDPAAQRLAQETEAARVSRLFAQTNQQPQPVSLVAPPATATQERSDAHAAGRCRVRSEHAGSQDGVPQRSDG